VHGWAADVRGAFIRPVPQHTPFLPPPPLAARARPPSQVQMQHRAQPTCTGAHTHPNPRAATDGPTFCLAPVLDGRTVVGAACLLLVVVAAAQHLQAGGRVGNGQRGLRGQAGVGVSRSTCTSASRPVAAAGLLACCAGSETAAVPEAQVCTARRHLLAVDEQFCYPALITLAPGHAPTAGSRRQWGDDRPMVGGGLAWPQTLGCQAGMQQMCGDWQPQRNPAPPITPKSGQGHQVAAGTCGGCSPQLAVAVSRLLRLGLQQRGWEAHHGRR